MYTPDDQMCPFLKGKRLTTAVRHCPVSSICSGFNSWAMQVTFVLLIYGHSHCTTALACTELTTVETSVTGKLLDGLSMECAVSELCSAEFHVAVL